MRGFKKRQPCTGGEYANFIDYSMVYSELCSELPILRKYSTVEKKQEYFSTPSVFYLINI